MIYIISAISILMLLALHIWQRYIELFPNERTLLYQPESAFIRKTLMKNFLTKQDTETLDTATKRKIALLKGFKGFVQNFAIVGSFFCILQLWLQLTAYSNLSQNTILIIEEK